MPTVSRAAPVAVSLACLAGWLTLGLVVAGGTGPTPPDALVESVARGLPGPVLQAFTVPTEPAGVFAVLAVAVAVAARRRQWRRAAVAVAAPTVAIASTTWVGKPLFDRWYDDHLAYPSGHTVAFVTTLTVLVLLTRAAVRVVVALGGAAVTTLAGVGMAGLGYHYATDVVGGAAFAVAVTTAVWLALAGPYAPRAPHRDPRVSR